MKVTVVLPKPQCYVSKDMGTQRVLKERFMKYLKLLSDCNCPVEILLEDTLARTMLFDAGITPARVVTCITPSDINLIQKYPHIEEMESYVFSYHKDTEKMIYDSETKYDVPLSVMKEGKNIYFTKRVQAYRKRYSYSINRYLAECQCVMQFRTDSSTDRGSAVKATAKNGDGRLCIEINMSNQTVSSYYGGVFITEDILPTILSL